MGEQGLAPLRGSQIPCDYPGCPNPAQWFWTVESVYCKEHLQRWREAADRIREPLQRRESSVRSVPSEEQP